MSVRIRSEEPSDVVAIEALIAAAFLNAAHSSHTEQFIVNALRKAGQLSISLVAEDGGEIVGLQYTITSLESFHYTYSATVALRGAAPPSRVTGKRTEVYLKQGCRWVMIGVSGRPDNPPGGSG